MKEVPGFRLWERSARDGGAALGLHLPEGISLPGKGQCDKHTLSAVVQDPKLGLI